MSSLAHGCLRRKDRHVVRVPPPPTRTEQRRGHPEPEVSLHRVLDTQSRVCLCVREGSVSLGSWNPGVIGGAQSRALESGLTGVLMLCTLGIPYVSVLNAV